MGFSGGKDANPSYRDVCTGRTGHVEVLEVRPDQGRRGRVAVCSASTLKRGCISPVVPRNVPPQVDLADPKGAGPAAVYEDLLKYFFMFHDPTTLNRQGNDAGTQYASVIFVHDEEQRRIANKVKAELQSLVSSGKVKGYSGKTVTTAVVAAGPFYLAQKAHQDYLNQNPDGYCNHRLRFKAWPKA